MKENMELERKDLVIDRDMEVDCDIGQQITCYIETWFDVDEKFRIKTDSDNGTWLNMYGKYNPFADTLRIECSQDHSDGFRSIVSQECTYQTDGPARLWRRI